MAIAQKLRAHSPRATLVDLGSSSPQRFDPTITAEALSLEGFGGMWAGVKVRYNHQQIFAIQQRYYHLTDAIDRRDSQLKRQLVALRDEFDLTWADYVRRSRGALLTTVQQMQAVLAALNTSEEPLGWRLAQVRDVLDPALHDDDLPPSLAEVEAYDNALHEYKLTKEALELEQENNVRDLYLTLIGNFVISVEWPYVETPEQPAPDPRHPETFAWWPLLVLEWVSITAQEIVRAQVVSPK